MEQKNTTVSAKTLGVMVIGAGVVSAGHMDYFYQSDNTKLIAVADPNQSALDALDGKYDDVALIHDYKSQMDSSDIDLVVVCTPHYLHFPIVMDSLKSGKHVLCEKPISISTKEADDMLDTAKSCGKELFVMLNNRFTPWARKIKEVLDDQGIGRVFMARSAYFGYETDRLADTNHWKGDLKKAGGGVLLDGGYHTVDLMNSWLGKAKTVSAVGGQYVVKAEGKGEDNISLLIEYENGAAATLQVSFTTIIPGCDKEPTLALEHSFMGTEGSLYGNYSWDPINDLINQLDIVTTKGKKAVDLDSVEPLVQLDHFISCLIDGTAPIVTAIDARNANAVVEAAYESIRTGKKVDVNWRA